MTMDTRSTAEKMDDLLRQVAIPADEDLTPDELAARRARAAQHAAPPGPRRVVRTELLPDGGGCWINTFDDGSESPPYGSQLKAMQAALDPEATSREHMRDRLRSLEEMRTKPRARALVDGLLYRNTLVQLAGKPGSYKSFVSVGLACAVAAGVTWEGQRVRQAGPVVYVAPEGSEGLYLRVAAWCESNRVPLAQVARNLHILEEPIQLGDRLDVTEAVEVARELGAVLTVLDTRARCTLGLEENSSTEQGQAIAAADAIRKASGGTVLGIHHSGRPADAGRGSNAWDGAVWSDLRIKGAELACVIHCEKHKDAPDGCDHHYRLIPYKVSEDAVPRGTHEDGQDWTDEEWSQARSTLVVVQTSPLVDRAISTASQGRVLDIFRTSAGPEGLSRAELIKLSEADGIPRATAYTAVATLAESGQLRNIGTEARHKYVVGTAYATPEEEA